MIIDGMIEDVNIMLLVAGILFLSLINLNFALAGF